MVRTREGTSLLRRESGEQRVEIFRYFSSYQKVKMEKEVVPSEENLENRVLRDRDNSYQKELVFLEDAWKTIQEAEDHMGDHN